MPQGDTMTSQTKHYIEIGDVLSWSFTCKNCKVALSFPAFEPFKVRKLAQCPTCNEPWLDFPSGSTISLAVENFQKALADLKMVIDDRAKLKEGFNLVFEIRCEATEVS
jgi:hypothetical protein